jgi:hypothetical protein
MTRLEQPPTNPQGTTLRAPPPQKTPLPSRQAPLPTEFSENGWDKIFKEFEMPDANPLNV